MASQNLSRQYYFAFGSNMCFAQMAERCPGSSFIGKAILRGYRWQINQRHVANIVKVDDDSQAAVVEGLVFAITDKDRRTLDRKEGIKIGVYERVHVTVCLTRDANLATKKTAFVRARLEDVDVGDSKTSTAIPSDQGGNGCDQPGQLPFSSHQEPPFQSQSQEKQSCPRIDTNKLSHPVSTRSSQQSLSNLQSYGGKLTDAITYLSTRYNEDGLIREEYAQRMENAMHDALKLGVSQEYFQKYLEPYVHGPTSCPDEEAQDKNLKKKSQRPSSEITRPEGKGREGKRK